MSEDLSGLDTFPKLLLHHARVRPERPAIREKDLGIWQTWTWGRFAEETRALACGLAAHGLKRGDHMALVGDNRPRLYAMMCAVQSLGAVPVPLYQDAVAAEMAFPIQNTAITHALAEDQEQVDKLLEILPQCPTLARIYYDDPRGMRHYAQPQLMSYEKLLEEGRAPGMQVARALAEHGDVKAVAPLRRALGAGHPAVRRGACEALGRLKAAEAAEELRGRLKDEDAGVRVEAARALHRLGDDAGVPALIEALADRWEGADARRALVEIAGADQGDAAAWAAWWGAKK